MTLTSAQQAVVDRAKDAPMLDQVLRWAAINSGSGNLEGLAAMAGELADACGALPGTVELLDPEPVTKIDAQGRESMTEHGRNLLLTVRPEAPVQVLLTGHMDTVFGPGHPFQTFQWLAPAFERAGGGRYEGWSGGHAGRPARLRGFAGSR
jgi:glutamate carboxypeptidase